MKAKNWFSLLNIKNNFCKSCSLKSCPTLNVFLGLNSRTSSFWYSLKKGCASACSAVRRESGSKTSSLDICSKNNRSHIHGWFPHDKSKLNETWNIHTLEEVVEVADLTSNNSTSSLFWSMVLIGWSISLLCDKEIQLFITFCHITY